MKKFNFEYVPAESNDMIYIEVDTEVNEDDSVNFVIELMEYNIDVDFDHVEPGKTVYVWRTNKDNETDRFQIEHCFKDNIIR